MNRPTNLLKALFLEKRLPWRYSKHFQNIYEKTVKAFNLNINTKRFWNSKFKKGCRSIGNENYKEILKHLPKDKNFSLLDIGCGLGQGCRLIKDNFPKADIHGCDFSKEAIKKARTNSKNITFSNLDIIKDNLSKRYDYIVLISVIEHFKHPKKIIKKCLKSSDNLILDCPYMDLGISHLYGCDEKTFREFNPRIKRYDNRIIYLIRSN
ncbi:methyltransferase domain-containing protein [Candidatus Woesearchaeota archaeon]|nr:methyltransferase domain-containing protein [Candidatus Woesearchaeota archaeon]